MGRNGGPQFRMNRNARIDPALIWDLAIAGLQGVEVARLLGCSPAYVSLKLRPIRQILRLRREGVNLIDAPVLFSYPTRPPRRARKRGWTLESLLQQNQPAQRRLLP